MSTLLEYSINSVKFISYKGAILLYNNASNVVEIKVSDCFISNTNLSYNNSDLDELIDSINNVGLVDPVIVRRKGSMYEVIHGRRRYKAFKETRAEYIPAIVTNIGGDNLWLELKLQQEGVEALSHSELATLIFMYHKSIKHQGRSIEASDSNSFELMSDKSKRTMNSDSLSGKKFRLSARTISRYLRVYLLSDSLKQLLDVGLISLRVAVELSYTDLFTQELIASLVKRGCVIDIEKSVRLRRLNELGQVTDYKIKSILKESKNSTGFKPMIKIFRKYHLSRYTVDEIENIVDKALKMYFSNTKFKVSWHDY